MAMRLAGVLFAAAMTLLSLPAAYAETKISVGYTPNAEAAPAFVARDQGFFEKRGLAVELVPVAINSTLPAALLSDSIQFGATSPPVFLNAIDNGMELVAVAGMSVSARDATGVGIIARPGSGITDAASLKGKKVATPGIGAILHVMARRWLLDKGVDPASVTFVEAAFPTHADLLRSGAVDAVITVDPFMSRIVASGGGTQIVNLVAELPEGTAAQFFSATTAFTEKAPDAVKAFREAIAEGAAFVAAKPDETRAIIGKYIKLPPQALASIPLPKADASITPAQIDWWIKVMQLQGMLQTTIDAAKVVYR
jgi:NitT/TauT family transport system substrate-binding protein